MKNIMKKSSVVWQRSEGAGTLCVREIKSRNYWLRFIGHFDAGGAEEVNAECLFHEGFGFLLSCHAVGIILDLTEEASLEPTLRALLKACIRALTKAGCKIVMVLGTIDDDARLDLQTSCRQADTLQKALKILEEELKNDIDASSNPGAGAGGPMGAMPFAAKTLPLFYNGHILLGPSFGATIIAILALLLLGTKGEWSIAFLQFAWSMIKR